MRTLQLLGLTPEKVRALIGPQVPAPKYRSNENPELAGRIRALRATGLKYREIAKATGVSISTVNRYCE